MRTKPFYTMLLHTSCTRILYTHCLRHLRTVKCQLQTNTVQQKIVLPASCL